MTITQRKLLLELASTLDKLSEEALNDDNFNNTLYELGIFRKSIDECSAEILDVLE